MRCAARMNATITNTPIALHPSAVELWL